MFIVVFSPSFSNFTYFLMFRVEEKEIYNSHFHRRIKSSQSQLKLTKSKNYLEVPTSNQKRTKYRSQLAKMLGVTPNSKRSQPDLHADGLSLNSQNLQPGSSLSKSKINRSQPVKKYHFDYRDQMKQQKKKREPIGPSVEVREKQIKIPDGLRTPKSSFGSQKDPKARYSVLQRGNTNNAEFKPSGFRPSATMKSEKRASIKGEVGGVMGNYLKKRFEVLDEGRSPLARKGTGNFSSVSFCRFLYFWFY